MENTLNKKHKSWWKTIDMKDDYLSKLWGSLFGTSSQRIKQLYIVRDNLNLKLK